MKFKKMFALLVSVVLLLSALAVPASAIDVSLSKQEQWVSSSSLWAKQVEGNGSNSKESNHYVYFQFYYRKNADFDWSKDTKKYMRPGTSFSSLKSTYFNNAMEWLYQLNATGTWKGCSATGSFWKIV